MPADPLRLTTDEYAAALLIAGAVELALNLLVTAETSFNSDDVMPRLQAGTAALEARGLVIDGQTLSAEVEPVVLSVARPDFTLYLRKTVAGVDDGLALHFRDAAVVAQHIEEETHTLTSLPSLDACTQLAAAFFGVDGGLPAIETFSLPVADVSPLLTVPDADGRVAAIDVAGIASRHAQFAADAASPESRGSFLRVDYAHGHPTTRSGATVIAGPGRVWLLRGAPTGFVQITHATFLSVHDELYSLSRLSV